MKHLIFDLYGTLIHSKKKLTSTKKHRLMSYGEKTWMKEDKPEESYFDKYAQQQNINPEQLKNEFLEMEQTTEFFTEIPELLQELHQEGYKLHILSNCGRSTQQFIKKHEQTFSLFTTINLSYQYGRVKPDKQLYKEVLKHIRAQPEECVMIGDSPRDDIKPAQELGLQTIHFVGREQPVQELHEKIQKLN